MEIIYKGTLYTALIVSPVAIKGARLYNLAMQVKIDTQLTPKGKCLEDGTLDDSGKYELYEIQISPSTTSNNGVDYIGSASIPQGIYNLELFSMDTDNNPIIQAYYENYAKVKESSFSKEYN